MAAKDGGELVSRIDLDKRQAEELARFVIENHDRLPEGVYLTTSGRSAKTVRAEARGEDGRITTTAYLRPGISS